MTAENLIKREAGEEGFLSSEGEDCDRIGDFISPIWKTNLSFYFGPKGSGSLGGGGLGGSVGFGSG